MPTDWCPFCPGSGRVPEHYEVHLYPNDFAAFRLDNPQFQPETELFGCTGARGATDVVLYSPVHNVTPAQLSASHWCKVIGLWNHRYQELTAHPDIEYVYIFENTGTAIGVTMPHPHGQIYSFPFLPPLVERELNAASDYYSRSAECIYCQLLGRELEDGRRIVTENESFVAFVPYASRFPAEMQICPRRHLAALPDLREKEGSDLAAVLKAVRMKY